MQTILAITRGESPNVPFVHGTDLGSDRLLFEDVCQQCWNGEPGLRPSMDAILGSLAIFSTSNESDSLAAMSQSKTYEDELAVCKCSLVSIEIPS